VLGLGLTLGFGIGLYAIFSTRGGGLLGILRADILIERRRCLAPEETFNVGRMATSGG
jgi:hypothetical protein